MEMTDKNEKRAIEGTIELTKDLIEAKKKFPPIVKNKSVKAGSFTYEYADLPSILNAIEGPLAERGMVLTQPLKASESGGNIISTILRHKSGAFIECSYHLPSVVKMQDAGKDITYFRRYGICTLLCIMAEDDTDGNDIDDLKKNGGAITTTFSGEKGKISKDQIKILQTKTAGYLELQKTLLIKANIKSLIDLDSSKFDTVNDWVDEKLAEMQRVG